MACRLASWPTSRSPFSRKATTDGVVREPSALGMTSASPPSQAAITELVVPRSIPAARGISGPRRKQSKRFLGHVVVDDHLEALRAHHHHGGEVAAPALQGIDDHADDRAD